MIIIGMTGPIGHGKSTFADALHKLVDSSTHLESSEVIAGVANAMHDSLRQVPDRDDIDSINAWLRVLPAILLQQLGVRCNFDQIEVKPANVEKHPVEYEKLFLHIDNLKHNPELLQHRITPENKENYRSILQWLGSYLVKHVSPSIWYDEIVRQVKQAAQKGYALCTIGGLRYPTDAATLRTVPGVIIVKVYRPGHLQYDALDPTERERDNIPADVEIVSDSDVPAVERCAKQFLADLKNNSLKKTYHTAES